TAETLRAMPNILTVSTTYDSATPFDQGVVAAAAIGGTLLIAAGNDHTSYGGVECVTDVTNEYFRTLRVRADIPGTEGVQTKDVHSNLVTGNECTVTDEFRPVTALDSGEGEPGETLTLAAEGLVRNSEYVVDWQHGSVPLTASAEGTGDVEVTIPAAAEAGSYDLVLTPGIAGENDPAIRAEATLQVLPDQEPEPEPTATPTNTTEPEDPDPEEPGGGAGTEPGGDTEAGDSGDSGDPDTGTDPDLSTTGVRVGTVAIIAVVVIAAGGAVYLISRRNGAKQRRSRSYSVPRRRSARCGKRFSSGSSAVRHRASHTSWGATPSARACSAVRSPSPSSTRSAARLGPSEPNASRIAAWNSECFTPPSVDLRREGARGRFFKTSSRVAGSVVVHNVWVATPDPKLPFSDPTAQWFTRAFAAPTEAQAQAWKSIHGSAHTLVVAPTGSGKTLAAFLSASDHLATGPEAAEPQQRCRVVSTSPLMAFAADVDRILRSPLVGIEQEARRLGVPMREIRVGTRTGDTPASERRRFATDPPDILITTPESLFLML